MFLTISEWLLGALLLLAVLTQLVFPTIRGQKLFPLFRRSQSVLEKELTEAMQKTVETGLKEEIRDVKQHSRATSYQRRRQRQRQRNKMEKP